MRLAIQKLLVLITMLAFSAGYATAIPAAKTSSKNAKSSHRHGKKHKTSWKKKGQQAIQPGRATEIQQALIREKYLSGEPTGVWDARTQAALVKYQGDNGWQTKVVPDSRALIKLGLGPRYSAETLLNAPASSASAAALSGAANTAASRGINGASDKQ